MFLGHVRLKQAVQVTLDLHKGYILEGFMKCKIHIFVKIAYLNMITEPQQRAQWVLWFTKNIDYW